MHAHWMIEASLSRIGRRSAPLRFALGVSTLLLLGIGGIAGVSQAADDGAAACSVGSAHPHSTHIARYSPHASMHREGQLGVDCVTRLVRRRVGRWEFVVEQAAHCVAVPVRRCDRSHPTSDARPVPRAIAEDEQIVSDPAPSAERLAAWSARRDRFSNAQYASSLRGLRAGIRRIDR